MASSAPDDAAAPSGHDEGSTVVVSLAVATKGLPDVCAITGKPADGAIPLKVGRSLTKWNAPVVRVPLSDSIFTRWSRRKNIHIKGRGIASALAVVGVAVAFRNGALAVAILAVALAIHLVDMWAERTANEVEPQLERQGGDVRISGVHENFVQAVELLAK